jgi:membrane-associated phospholipid phosphatase
MITEKITIGKIQLNATDGLILGTLALLSLLSAVFFWRVEHWWLLILKNIAVGAAYIWVNRFSDKATTKFWKFFFRMAPVVLAYAYLFGAVDKLQMIFQDQWMDDYVLDFEQYVFGLQPTLWIEDYISKPLTEWMMFSYVIYVPMYPVLCGIIYYKRGEMAMEDYFFTLGFTNVLCDIGFILFPVASPMYHIKELYTVPLDGYVFTYLGELMRKYLHFAGGSIPSPHAAAATIMWMMAYRYHRTSFWILTPIVLSLYVSTFYGRYHYVTDAIVGILVAGLALIVAPLLMKLWNKIAERTIVSAKQ